VARGARSPNARTDRCRIVGSRERSVSASARDPSGAIEPCAGAVARGEHHRGRSAFRSDHHPLLPALPPHDVVEAEAACP
jgi:hypothetical protein